jgi:c-di-AMP phosphodiesterase-like protein
MEEKNQKVKLKGRFQSYLIWPLIMLILFAVMDGFIFMFSIKAGFVALAASLVYAVCMFALYYTVRREVALELVNFALDYGQVQKTLLEELKVPYGVLDEHGRFLWVNHQLKELTGTSPIMKSVDHFFKEIDCEHLPKDDEKVIVNVKYDKYIFRAELARIVVDDFSTENQLVDIGSIDNTLVTIYLFDETEIRRYMKENQEQRLVCGTIFIDNYDEALESTEEVRRSLLTALVERKITKYMQGYDAIIHKTANDRFQFVIQQKYLPMIQSSKFSILDEVREINIGNDLPITLCIGVGVNGANYAQSAEWSKNAIDLALGRGGDQAVVKDGDRISYYGGKTKQVEKSTRVRARVKAHALKQLLAGKETVMIMGHKIGDADSFGASIGMYRIARTLNKRTHIVINTETTSVKAIKSEFMNNSNYEPDMFINASKAMEMIDENTVLIVVDVNRPSMAESSELLALAKTIVVLDHHRQSSDSIDNALLSYIEPYASSACEMVAEIMQYIADGIKLRPVEADAMFAGVLIDTNNFMNKTGARTFEAAAYLRKSGADIVKVRTKFRDDLTTYKVRADAVSRATIFDSIFAFAECRAEGMENPTVIGAQVANELLNITNIKASFVFTEVKGRVYISARSYEEINVQLVMEKFGGGGHSAIAGAQIDGISVEAAMTKVKMQLRMMQNEGEI